MSTEKPHIVEENYDKDRAKKCDEKNVRGHGNANTSGGTIVPGHGWVSNKKSGGAINEMFPRGIFR